MNYSDDNYVLYDSTIISYIVFSILLFFMCICIFICKLNNFAVTKHRLYYTEMNSNMNENMNENINDNDNENDNANANILNRKPPSYNSINEN